MREKTENTEKRRERSRVWSGRGAGRVSGVVPLIDDYRVFGELHTDHHNTHTYGLISCQTAISLTGS